MTSQAALSQSCVSCGDTMVLPRRHKTLWRITTTKTVEGLLVKEPAYESKKTVEDLCETMTKKHAMESAKLMKEMEYEETRDRDLESRNEMKKEAERKDQGWKSDI